MRDMMMVPAGEFQRMRQRYMNQASTNTVLEKVGDLGATEDAILESNLPTSMAIKLASPLERRRRALTTRLRRGGERGSSYSVDDDPEPLTNTPSEALVKKLITTVRKNNPNRPRGRQLPTPGIPGPGRALLTPPRTPKPTSAGPSKLPRLITEKRKSPKRLRYDKTPKSKNGMKEAAIKGASKSLAQALGIRTRDKDSDDSSSDEEPSPRRTRSRYGRPQQPKSWEAYQEAKRGKKKP